MELKELTDKTLEILNIESVYNMSERLFKCVTENEESTYKKFCELIDNDLSIDWMQKIFQYYHADRKDKMQYYTPKSLADFMGLLAGESKTVIDMCAGSGALTIQKWNQNPNLEFELYEFDDNVLPFLMFNMALRNINCTILHADILKMEIYRTFKIKKGEKFGICKEVKNEYFANI